MSQPDFYVPFEGGQLPMLIISTEVEATGDGQYELRSVEMTIRAISCGPPVYVTPSRAAIEAPWELES